MSGAVIERLTFRAMLLHTFSGADNRTIDIARVGYGLAFLTGLGLAVVSVVRGQVFDIQQYGLGVGALLAAGGFGVKVKADTEPPAR